MRNYWWLNINPRMLRFKEFDKGDVFAYSSVNEDGSDRKVHSNFLEAKQGEIVIIYETVPVGRIVGLCTIEKEWKDNIICLKKVESLTENIPRTAIEDIREIMNIEAFRNQEGIFFKVSLKEFNTLYNIIREWNPKTTYMVYPNYSKEDFLEEVYFENEEYDELRDLIETKKNVILQGPPGVGKTYIAKKMAFSILGKKDSGKILNIQFHPQYGSDRFIEGFVPDDVGIYKYRQGCFKEFCEMARNDRNNKYFLIVDEINRGDIIKIFGDTFMLLEPDKRGKENYVELPVSKERFYIPNNVYIIGTMNKADKDQPMSDFAVRRRFFFYNIEPLYENKDFIKECEKNPLVEKTVKKVIEINKELEEHRKIGHCYFCNVENDKEFIRTVKYQLIPLIEEYFKDDKKLKERIVEELEAIISNNKQI